MDRIARERLLITLLLGLGLMLATGLLRKRDETGVHPTRFWSMKLDWVNCADCVVAGNSRVYRGVSPDAIRSVLGRELRVVNYGFSANGYSRRYLEAVEKVLDPHSPRRLVILGLDPYTLSRHAMQDNGFDAELKDRAKRPPWSDRLVELERFCEPIALNHLREALLPQAAGKHYYQEYQSNGWVASARVPEVPGEAAVIYERQFRSNPLESEAVDELLRFVQKWKAEGIAVYGFRPPTCTATLTVENHRSGFDEDAFVTAFRAAGGVWIPVSQTAYHSYDGSHLRRDGAEQMSTALAQRIQAHEQGGPEVDHDRPLAESPEHLFVPVDLTQPPETYLSHWRYRVERVDITAEDGGLRVAVAGGADTSGGQYGGLEFPAVKPGGIRLDLTFLHAENIQRVYVEGTSADQKTRMRWTWQPRAGHNLPQGRAAYLLYPGLETGDFVPAKETDAAHVTQIHVYLCVNPGTEAGFILHQAAVSPGEHVTARGSLEKRASTRPVD